MLTEKNEETWLGKDITSQDLWVGVFNEGFIAQKQSSAGASFTREGGKKAEEAGWAETGICNCYVLMDAGRNVTTGDQLRLKSVIDLFCEAFPLLHFDEGPFSHQKCLVCHTHTNPKVMVWYSTLACQLALLELLNDFDLVLWGST